MWEIRLLQIGLTQACGSGRHIKAWRTAHIIVVNKAHIFLEKMSEHAETAGVGDGASANVQ
jgi:hypothetical protein